MKENCCQPSRGRICNLRILSLSHNKTMPLRPTHGDLVMKNFYAPTQTSDSRMAVVGTCTGERMYIYTIGKLLRNSAQEQCGYWQG